MSSPHHSARTLELVRIAYKKDLMALAAKRDDIVASRVGRDIAIATRGLEEKVRRLEEKVRRLEGRLYNARHANTERETRHLHNVAQAEAIRDTYRKRAEKLRVEVKALRRRDVQRLLTLLDTIGSVEDVRDLLEGMA